MSDPLGQYVAAYQAKDQSGGPFGFTEIPAGSMPFIMRLGAYKPQIAGRGVSARPNLHTLPQPILLLLNDALPAADRLGPDFDYQRLAQLAEQQAEKLPPEAYSKLAAVAMIGLGRQTTHRTVAGQELVRAASGEALRQGTLGIHPESEVEYHDLGPQGVGVARALGALAGIAISGKLVFSALSRTTLLPKIGPLALQLPRRVREITLGVGTGAILDAARPDGLPEDPAAIDIPARLAHPVADFLGGGEVAERAALGLTGGAFGGVIGEVLGPVLRGIQAGRETYAMSKIAPDLIETIRLRLTEAGIGVTKAETNRSVIAKALRNLDRIGQNERLAGITALDETRIDFIMHQLYSDPAFSGPPKLPLTRVMDPHGQPLRVYRGELGAHDVAGKQPIQYFAEDPAHASIHAGGRGVEGGPSFEGQRVTPAYLDVRRPLDLTGSIPIPEDYRVAFRERTGGHEPSLEGVVAHPDDVFAAAKEAGYDGIKYIPPRLTPLANRPEVGLTSWVTFSPSQIHPAFVSDDAKLLAGVFRANPGGLSVARGITNIRAADELVKRMGLNVTAIRVGEDYLLLRPQINYPTRAVGAKLSKQMEDFTTYVRAANRGKPTANMAILPDGTPVRGEYNPTEMTSRYKLKPPVVDGGELHELALREHFGMVEVRVEKGGVINVNLPTTITQRQADVLARIADSGPPSMVINSAKPGLSRSIDQPWGMQVQDIMADLVQGADRPKISAATMAKVNQYRTTGVFQGQAAHLSDGYPVEVIRKVTNRTGQSEIIYRDPLTGGLHRVGADNIAILPTSLEGEFAPTLAFMEAMEPAERAAFATLRRGINEGLAKPIKTIAQLESFAATRGKFVTNLGKGRVRVHDANTGEARIYEDYKAAIRGIRESVGPLPDLTPPEIEELLGFKPNMGGLGMGGPPARFGEPIAITADEFDNAAMKNTLGELVPGAFEQFYKPTRALLLDIERRVGLPFGRVFLNLQEATVHRQNFVSAWMYGEGPGLPPGVKPWAEIYKMAGRPKDGAQRLMGAWMEAEADPIARAAIEAQLTSQQIRALPEARKWFGLGKESGLFKSLGVEAEFLTEYLPHARANAETYGNDISEIWRQSKGTPLPKAVEFFADYSRDGTLNLYEDRLFVAGAQYLNAGARTRFMNSAMDDAKKLLRAVSDNGIKTPLANFIEALRGSEFMPQRAALDASFTRMMRSLGASDKVAGDIGEKLTAMLLGLSYSATMAFRPGLAVRNAMQIFQTTWPLVGRFDDTFAEAIGRAMTLAGRDEAVRAGAITIRQTAVFAGEEVLELLPAPLRRMNELGFKLYDGADTFARAVSFHTAKLQTQRAIEEFGVALKKGGNLAEAQRVLLRRSGAMVLDKPIVDDFMRRLATSPENASDFIGKQITDVTQYLYGRGNQPRWMRSVPGRFLGQFGTWPLWYIDFTKRSFLNMWRGGYQKEALAFIGKQALVNAAIFSAGAAVGLDLRRWMSGNAMFYTGGPGVEVIRGTLDLVRGAGESFLGTYESPATKQRIAGGVRTLERVGLAFIPNMYAVRDIGRLLEARTPTEFLGAALATRPSTDYTVAQRLDLLFNPGRLSTDIDLETGGDQSPTAAEILIRGMGVSDREKLKLPMPVSGPLPPQPQGYEASPGGVTKLKVSTPATMRPSGRPPLEPSALPPSIRSGESKPIKQ